MSAASSDPWTLTEASALLDIVPDPARTILLPDAEPHALARALVALTNGAGGEVLTGVQSGPAGRVTALPGVEPATFEAALTEALALVDPPMAHLVQHRLTPAGEGGVGVVRVRLSPSSPHLVTANGGIYRIEDGAARPIRSRRMLDDLYSRGRGERERSDRLVEAMVEKLALGHYAFYTLAIIACTQQPSGEPFRTAQGNPAWLAAPDDPFVVAAELGAAEMKVHPGELELRRPGDVYGFLRITRTGCVAAGEVQRRPYHEELETVARLRERLTALAGAAGRLLAVSGDPVMMPHVFIEGVRGLRLVHDPDRRVLSANAPQDTARFPLTHGDARDPAYLARLPDEALDRLTTLFPAPSP
jgi:hypothetical protein